MTESALDRYEALGHAVKAHDKDTDKCGVLYVLHSMTVADFIDAPENEADLFVPVESAVIVALLHDVEEDTDYRVDKDDLTADEWIALGLVTRRPGDEYGSYIAKIVMAARHGAGDAGRIAAIVKLADLAHNLSTGRQRCLPESEQSGLEKRYLKARNDLWDALGSEWWPV
jgi:(p)ppGpp synthase/HD superfamily hydrolase